MIRSATEFVHLRKSEVPEEYARAADEEASLAVWEEVIDSYPEMREWVAHNKTVPLSVLKVLAADPEPRVRYTVAMMRKLSQELLRF